MATDNPSCWFSDEVAEKPSCGSADLAEARHPQHLVLREHVAVLRGVVAGLPRPVPVAVPRRPVPAGLSPERGRTKFLDILPKTPGEGEQNLRVSRAEDPRDIARVVPGVLVDAARYDPVGIGVEVSRPQQVVPHGSIRLKGTVSRDKFG